MPTTAPSEPGYWPTRVMPDTLYFIETECAERHIKIGVARNVAARMAAIQGNCPYRLRLLKRVPDAAHMERDLHRRFAKSRLHGEWFRRTPKLLALINSLEGLTEPEPARAARTPVLDTLEPNCP